MAKSPCILIADRNRHVRDYLKRELSADGYLIRLARNGREILRWIQHWEGVDLVVMDLNLPEERELRVLEKILEHRPGIKLIIHSFLADFVHHPVAQSGAVFVEKRGGSIDELKTAVAGFLKTPEGPQPATV